MRQALIDLSLGDNKAMTLIAGMLNIYLNRDVSPAWERARIEVEFFQGLKVAPDGYSPLVVADTPDVLGCGGYHDVDPQGRAYARVFLPMIPKGTILRDPTSSGASLAGVLSHEAAEMALDILANAYQDGPFVDTNTGRSYAQVAVELCDPVQELAYPILVGTEVVDASNFVFPGWFNRRFGVGKVDQMGALRGPLTLAPGGYAIVRDTSADLQVFARLFKGKRHKPKIEIKKIIDDVSPPPEWREAMKALPGSRTSRRLQAAA